MSAFTGELRLASLDADCRVWRLEEPLRYEVGAEGSGLVVTVPAGFVTDGASIPRFMQAVLPPFGKWSRAAILHDYLWRAVADGRPVEISGYGVIAHRRGADAIFHEAMLVCGVSKWLAWAMWAAVRLADRFPALQAASAV